MQETIDLGKKIFREGVVYSFSSGHGHNSLPLMGVGLFMQQIEEYFDYVFNSSIDSIKYENKDCYLIKKDTTEIIVEKSTGLLLRFIANGNAVSYKYSFGTVTDKDIEKPDISGYKKYGSDW